jgi:phosphoribosylamine--glycine ligase
LLIGDHENGLSPRPDPVLLHEGRVRILGVGETCDLGGLYLSLRREGHEVKVFVGYPDASGTLAGLVDRTPDWRAELDWVRAAGAEGVVVFESVSAGFGALQDELRLSGLNVIGGSAWGDRLENDRAFAQGLLEELGFPSGHSWSFEDAAAGAAFIAETPARYVLKASGAGHTAADTYVGATQDGADVAAVLRSRAGRDSRFILQRFIEGVEMGVGAFFNGECFLLPACLDWEHKRFFAGDLGELTGEMGTVATFTRTRSFFDRTLRLLEAHLASAGHVGWVNLNTIVNERGIWPLEFTCRFGYPGFAVLAPLQPSWGELLSSIIVKAPDMRTAPGFSVGVVITSPPFPYSRREVDEPIGLPVIVGAGADPAHIHYGEVGLDETGQLCTSGLYGWTLVVTGTGATIASAKAAAYDNISRVVVPNARWRLDIGDRLIAGDFARLESLGLLDPALADPPTSLQLDASA